MNPLRWRQIVARFLLVIGGLLLGALIAEATLRLAGISYPLLYVPDPHAGSRLRPHFRGWYQKEGRALVRTNRWGFRDRDRAEAKPADTLRIAVLGDSFAEALQVPREQAFWSVLERELVQPAAALSRRLEVLNFGVSGYGTAQQLCVLRQYVWRFQPDVVLLAFFAGNDLRNNSKQLETDQVRPFYRIGPAGELVLDDSFLTHPDYLKSCSNLVQLKVKAINCSRLLQLAAEYRNRQAAAPLRLPAGKEIGLDANCFREPRDPAWRDAWQISERLVVAISQEVRSRGAQLLVVTVPSAIQVHPDPATRQAYAGQLQVPDLDYADQRIQSLANKYGFEVVLLSSPMRRYAESQGVYLHGFRNTELGKGHWNAAGHQLAGQLIAQAVRAASLLRQATDD